ncbi:sulfite exporter TauE/SafE family protein [Craterilacuibacter sinensis]|uniref:Probable membrane transporter protein n=1 Tax=Craterilacuibacter sinensis TaxID=2686017 RepID=A0A845BPT9_9NEIS|nr:sulfite exporter TauE/SafE family protein [Craterilacuibacter sinensis]MXR36491.1 TSUP family transporter [Craterilacuibacter sinensis]
MSPELGGMLFGAGFVAGALNAVAGGGTLITFPALVAAGLPPIVANATSSVAQWPGYVASSLAMRRELRGQQGLLPLAMASVAGGIGGGYLVSVVSNALFMALVPWLILLATLLFWQGKRLTAFTGARAWPLPLLAAAQFAIAVYGGFFGGGMGVMMLALFALALPDSLLRQGALKNGLSVLIAGGGVLAFMLAGLVDWAYGGVMLLGTMAGGVGGVHLARRIPPAWLKGCVVALGLVLSAVFFWR